MAGVAALAAAILAGAPARAATGGASASGPDLGAAPSLLGGTAPVAASQADQDMLAPPPGGATARTVAAIHGRLQAARGGRRVVLALFDAQRGWTPIGSAGADRDGTFVVSWRPQHIGRFLLRASVSGRTTAAGHATGPTAPIDVYRRVIATFFGPGSYGSRTACGQILTPELIGVAHRTLPCGTLVDISYGAQTISVPVVDRGPYANGASYDLTTATAEALGVSDTVRIGAVAIRTGALGSD